MGRRSIYGQKLGYGVGLRGGAADLTGGAGFAWAATSAALDLIADSGSDFRSRLILAISSGAKVSLPFFMTARTFLKSTSVRISASGIPNSCEASLSVFMISGMSVSP